MATIIGEDYSNTFDNYGHDGASDCDYRVTVVTTEVDPEAEDPTAPPDGLLLNLRYRFCNGLTSWYNLEFSGRITEHIHRDALRRVLDTYGVPVAARDEALRNIFNMYGVFGHVEPIKATVRIYAYNYLPCEPTVEIDEEFFFGLDEDDSDSAMEVSDTDEDDPDGAMEGSGGFLSELDDEDEDDSDGAMEGSGGFLYELDDEDDLERAMEASAADFLGPKPASREAVEALEKATIRADLAEMRETTCVVCLEGFWFGSKVTRMPCSHTFHQDCIDRWLECRNFCPLCRFELPPAS